VAYELSSLAGLRLGPEVVQEFDADAPEIGEAATAGRAVARSYGIEVVWIQASSKSAVATIVAGGLIGEVHVEDLYPLAELMVERLDGVDDIDLAAPRAQSDFIPGGAVRERGEFFIHTRGSRHRGRRSARR